MTDSLLLKTAKNLVPIGIFLRNSNISTYEDFNRHTCEEGNQEVQYKGSPGSEYKALLDDKSREGVMLFKIEVGVRLVDSSLNEDDDGYVKIEISAIFEAEYQLLNPDEFNEDGMSEFLNANVHHHVWPYWREYVQSTCARIGIPEITIPFRLPQPKEKKKAPTKGKVKQSHSPSV